MDKKKCSNFFNLLVKNILIIYMLCFVNFFANPNPKYYPSKTWMKKEPQKMGWSLTKLQYAKQYFENSGATAIMVIDDGYIIAEWGDTSKRANCFSVRKSFMSALFGIYVNEGRINLSSTLGDLKIDDIEHLSSIEKEAKVSDLLKARSGVYHPAAYETKRMKKRRPSRGSHNPNTFFYYNNWDFNTLGTIFEQETSDKIFDAFQKRIAKPICMNDFRIKDGKYVKESVSIHPAYVFWMSARDRARFGLLYLRGGKWKNKQIIPKQWISESMVPYSKVSKGIGYGYMWWTSTGRWHLGNNVQGDAYSARGYWGQYIVVLPKENLVIVQVSDKSAGGKNVHGKKFNTLLKLILDAKKN
jgi:CubicO group peptidase (beta-lactamase class C family)